MLAQFRRRNSGNRLARRANREQAQCAINAIRLGRENHRLQGLGNQINNQDSFSVDLFGEMLDNIAMDKPNRTVRRTIKGIANEAQMEQLAIAVDGCDVECKMGDFGTKAQVSGSVTEMTKFIDLFNNY